MRYLDKRTDLLIYINGTRRWSAIARRSLAREHHRRPLCLSASWGEKEKQALFDPTSSSAMAWPACPVEV